MVKTQSFVLRSRRPNIAQSTLRRFFTSHQRQPQNSQHLAQFLTNITNGNAQCQYKPLKPPEPINRPAEEPPIYQSLPPDGRRGHMSRLSTFQTLNNSHQRNDNQSYLHQRTVDLPHQSTTEPNDGLFKSYSPFKAYQNPRPPPNQFNSIGPKPRKTTS
jgi:hypothetical protein